MFSTCPRWHSRHIRCWTATSPESLGYRCSLSPRRYAEWFLCIAILDREKGIIYQVQFHCIQETKPHGRIWAVIMFSDSHTACVYIRNVIFDANQQWGCRSELCSRNRLQPLNYNTPEEITRKVYIAVWHPYFYFFLSHKTLQVILFSFSTNFIRKLLTYSYVKAFVIF